MRDEYFYPLYEQLDKDFFNKLKFAVKEGFAFRGSDEDKQKFVKDLLVLQLIKDYRKHLRIIWKYFDRDVDVAAINREASAINFGFDASWVFFKAEKELILLGKKLTKMDLKFEGSDKKFNEFVLRYLISIWLVDWSGPLYVILKKIEEDEGIVDLRELNKILSLWDFTGIFNNN